MCLVRAPADTSDHADLTAPADSAAPAAVAAADPDAVAAVVAATAHSSASVTRTSATVVVLITAFFVTVAIMKGFECVIQGVSELDQRSLVFYTPAKKVLRKQGHKQNVILCPVKCATNCSTPHVKRPAPCHLPRSTTRNGSARDARQALLSEDAAPSGLLGPKLGTQNACVRSLLQASLCSPRCGQRGPRPGQRGPRPGL